jgi:hypothetical protein
LQLRESSQGVSLIINGNRRLIDLEVEARLLEDKEELEDQLLKVINQAIAKADAAHEKEMQSVAKGMLPGMDRFK